MKLPCFKFFVYGVKFDFSSKILFLMGFTRLNGLMPFIESLFAE